MKKTEIVFLLCFMTLGLFWACTKSDIIKVKTRVSITEDKHKEYQLSASFSTYKARKVQNIINDISSPQVIFKTVDDDLQGDFQLKDGTRFYLKSEKGFLEIKFDKSKNSEASYQKVKKLFGAISEALK